ncbi:unnamed protein product [Adineta steineri]|uniref:NACHT domain-containing protein n=1 Tax=Adineta steineri TaxID=433720 RepID=A0A814FVZ7_9BILA|nr:unnamed protein product [Adineta steineri]CAF0990210.1 unnamed protein product [Adineta steineri]
MDAIGSAAIHQEEFQLVMKRLTNIAKILNTQESSIDDDAMKRVLPNLEITIKALRICLEEDHKFEISSTNKSQKLKYDQRHIQTVLFDALERLLSHEADLIKDPEPRAKLLSEGYFEQQMLRRKIFEKELKLREEAAKVDASKTCKELLFQLHQEHGYIITSYLEQCLILHGTVPVAGLDAAVVGNVVARFYGVTPAQQGAFEQNWRSFQMPLEHCSIQVRADQSTSFERKAARQMLMDDKLDLFFNFKHKHSQGGTWVRRLLNAPYMPTMVKRDRFQLEDKGDSFEISDVLRKHRWIVILGDPGSGKTTFVRWLMLQYAQAFRDGQDELIFGFTRMPILIRIGEFAEALAENNSLTLFDYIGHHKWFGKPVLPPNMINSSTAGQISRALQDYVKKGQALIILDGLDEIPASEQRSALVNLVEKFVDEHVKTPLFGSALDNLHAMHLNDNPSQSGGNQLLITSRIVGYHAAPVTGHFSHFIIKHMDQDSMKAFVDFWFHAVHMKIIDLLKLIDSQIPAGEYTWIRHARMLKTELDNNDNVGLLELASNALLITVICGIAFGSKEMSLPKQRILLYSETVNSMLLAWNNKGSSINEGKLVSILGDIAEHIHQNSSSGLIEEEDLKKICALSIRSYENMQNPTADDLKRFDNEALQFAQIIRDDVGILAARGESMYGFLHLTFQEYFASLNLTNKQKLKHKSNSAGLTDVQLIAQSLHQHIYDPRFRVILSLAFGKLSLNQKKGYFDSICSAFLSESRAANFFVPLAPLLLISCGNDLSQPLSSDVLFDVLDLLLVAAGRDNWYSTSPNLFTQLLKSVDKLPDASVTDFIHRFLSQHLSQKPPYYGDINTYDPQSTTFEFYGNFSFSVVSDNTTDVFCFEPGPVAVMNNTYSTIFMPLQCHAEISRLLLLKYDLQKKTYAQSSWYLKTGTFYYLYYDSHRQRLFGLRDVYTPTYIMEEYNTTTLEVIQEYTRQNGTQYGFACQGCSVFNPDENWIVEIRIVSAGQHYDAYYMKMDLNLVGKKQDIVTEFQKLPEFVEPYTMTYDIKTKLVLVTWKHGTIFTDTMMIYINPYTGKLHNEASLLKTPFGWFVQSVQALFDESTRQILFLIQQSDLQQIQISVWAITVEFDTMKIIEKKQVNALAGLQAWTFFKTEKKSNS